MAVKIGSARIGETGHITGNKAGDQTGNEVGTQNWYLHSKGWRVFRAKDPEKRKLIAKAMEMACANPHIGYDQNERSTLYTNIKPYGFDTSKTTKNVETDCSALVRVCCAYAGIMVSDFNTSTEATRLLNCGEFTELKDDKYTKKSDYLMAGDIAVTKTKGHTIVVLTNGSKITAQDVVNNTSPSKEYKLGDRILKNGITGADVKELQLLLIQFGYSCGKYGADGDFGDATEFAVRSFQQDNYCDVDGEVGKETLAALLSVTTGDGADVGKVVRILDGNCYIRTEPSTAGDIIGVAKMDSEYNYAGKKSEAGWLYIEYAGSYGWVSGKYGTLV